MSIFDPVATYTTSTPQDEFAAALNEPYVAKDILDDPNLRFFTDAWMHGITGTGIRDLTLPPLNPIAANRYERPEDFAARRAAAEAANPSLSPDQYKASPSYREQIPWEQGMTEDRAAAKAAQFDQSYLTQQLAEKKPLESFFMSLASGFADPTNFIVPYLGAGMGAAAAARFGWGTFGKIAAEGAVAAGNNALASGVFSALTASVRQKLGEDVSFNAIVNEIAMSAIIGGAFGTGIHLLGGLRNRSLMKRAADALETIDTTTKARAISEIAADMLARRGEVELPPAAIETVKEIKDRVEQVTAPERDAAVATETAKLPNQPGMEVVTPGGLTIRAVPEVVDLRTLNQASGDMQIRDRSRFSSDAWVMENAGKLDGNRLLPDRNAGLGAPVVGQDGTINSGNGRVKLIMQAANAHPEAYAAYLNTLREKGYVIPEAKNGEVYGLVMKQATDMTPEGQAAWNTDANAPLVARMSSAEIAMMDSRAMTDETLAILHPGELTSAANAEFRRKFIDNLPALERGVMLTAEGNLSKDGATRIENAIVAAAYGKADPGVVRRFAETEDENARAVIGAMADVAPKWASFVREVARGDLSPEADMSTELTQALSLISRWREQASQQRRPTSAVIREKMNQVDIFDGDMKPEVKAFITMFYRDGHFATAMGREKLAENLSRLIDELRSSAAPSLFADPKFLATPLEVLTHVTDTRLGNVPEDGRLFAYPEGNGVAPGAGQGNRSGAQEGGQADGGAAKAAPATEGLATRSEASIAIPARLPPADIVTSSDPHVIREQNAKRLLDLADAGDIDAIVKSPALAKVTEIMNSYPATDRVDGYESTGWYESRSYIDPEEPATHIVGVQAAVEHLIENARTLASKELGEDPYPIAQQRRAVVVIGPPAAGKSTIANQIAKKMHASIPDADEAKKLMPEYRDGIGAAATHEESGYLADIVLSRLATEGDNLVIPKVGGKEKSMLKLVEHLHKFDYKVELVLMDVPPGEAFRRMIGRYVRTGRLIPPDYFNEVATAPLNVFNGIKETSAFDGYARVKSERGLSPRLEEGRIEAAGLNNGDEVAIGGGGGQRPSPAGGDRGGGGPVPAEQIGRLPEVSQPEAPPKEPPTPEIEQAKARLAKAETPADIAELVGIDPKTGDFPEMKDVEQIKFEGRLTEEDQAVLDQAKANYDNAVAYGKALEAAVACVK